MALLPLLLLLVGSARQDSVALPPGVRAEWGLQNAWRETTLTRERVCLNGLWRWRPGRDEMPTGGWGWFKVPGPWPGITDYMEKDCQTVYRDPSWAKTDVRRVTTAWYRREITVPASWSGRRIAVSASYVNSLATVFVDGKQAGAITYPAGDVDITKVATAGSKHELTIQVVALPLKAVMMSYSDTNSAKQMQATVDRRGLCGDVFLTSVPRGPHIDSVIVDTSFRQRTLTVRVHTAEAGYQTPAYTVKILDHGRVIKEVSFPIHNGSVTRFSRWLPGRAGRDSLNRQDLWVPISWMPEKLWDTDTPQNQYDLQLTLKDSHGKVLDVSEPQRFGFRELWIDGRNFYLNGTRIFWSCVPLENAGISAGLSSYEGAKETMRRLQNIGVNMVYTHNYDCRPGSFLSFDEILRAADDVGMLVALTQPHFADYDWSKPDSDITNGYARHAAFFAQVAGNHPSVIAYSTSHNATGYNGDIDPDEIDGIGGVRDSWAENNRIKALRAEAIIKSLDPSRIVYHHSSGNLGSMHTMNFYLNFAPIQEMDDWFEHWATVGVKPAFMVEYGVPFSWDWSLYRGYNKGRRSFGSAEVPWEVTMAEWNAQFLGDRAYNISEVEKQNIRWEANKFKTSAGWFRWDYPHPMGSTDPGFEDQQAVWAKYTTDNWRAFRTWGVSGISPWETVGTFWRLKPGVNHGRVELRTDWGHLQRPGYSPDYVDGRYDRRDLAYDDSDWAPTVGGKSLIANNGPVLGYIAGKPGAFTDKTHIYHAGESFEKQLILINNSRRTVDAMWSWRLNLPTPAKGTGRMQLPTGEISKVPIHIALPAGVKAGEYTLSADISFSAQTGSSIGGAWSCSDEFKVRVLPDTPKVSAMTRLAIYDPVGETAKLLTSLGVHAMPVSAGQPLDRFDMLIVGKKALTVDGPGPNLSRVRNGLKTIVFEQTSGVLEQRFGFRVEEYGLRNVFRRVADHPALAGLDEETLRDWRGAATIYPPRGKYIFPDQFFRAPSIYRNGMLEPRVWRAGNRGSVASVIIEKPTIGDFMPIVDGGFSLQYSPLMEYREGKGMVLFCQLDVTGRTEADPAAQRLVANLLNYTAAWRSGPERTIAYSGDPAGKRHLEASGFTVKEFKGWDRPNMVAVIGPDGAKPREVYGNRFPKGDSLTLNVGSPLTDAAGAGLTEMREYITTKFQSGSYGTLTAGIGPADLFNRDPRLIPLTQPNDSVLDSESQIGAQFQLAPWTFDPGVINTKRVFRHTSFALSRLLGNMGVHASTPLLERFNSPAQSEEKRWLTGLYIDTPILEDDPYRFFGW